MLAVVKAPTRGANIEEKAAARDLLERLIAGIESGDVLGIGLAVVRRDTADAGMVVFAGGSMSSMLVANQVLTGQIEEAFLDAGRVGGVFDADAPYASTLFGEVDV